VLAELGFAGLQVWQPLSEAAGRGHGPQEMAVMFTDLAGLSSWALKAGDEPALALLREVGTRVETTEEIEVDGYRPSMRVGVHWGWPRDLHVVRVGRD
jgi:adenylate cyclase